MTTTLDLSDARWVKSTYSNGDGGACVEWAPAHVVTSGVVPVRDSKNPAGPALAVAPAAFAAFVDALREDRLSR
ncbi:DUF397 domain-containing protein [Streptomyces sp. NBC_01506]|uniref:DUF397 domain-containing protein n=1 Tax=Streptomyces sp. NBC_01506 TaxID=2903887 RepID=UPI00386A609B